MSAVTTSSALQPCLMFSVSYRVVICWQKKFGSDPVNDSATSRAFWMIGSSWGRIGLLTGAVCSNGGGGGVLAGGSIEAVVAGAERRGAGVPRRNCGGPGSSASRPESGGRVVVAGG